jgi:hypothetical protein
LLTPATVFSATWLWLGLLAMLAVRWRLVRKA